MCKKNMDGQGTVYSEVSLLLFTIDLAINPRNYNIGITKNGSLSYRLINK